ncbi:pectin lyase [Botrytis cinerea]
MVSIKALAILLFSVIAVDAAGVIGKAEGFAAAATGGGTAAAASPKDLNELVTWLSDGVARTIVLDKTWDFTGSMGSKTERVAHPCPTHAPMAANANQALAKPTITYDVAGIPPNAIKIGSNKSIVGVGSAGKIKGRGFYIAGAKNIIIQNVEFVEMNPKYIWAEMLSPLMAQIFCGSITSRSPELVVNSLPWVQVLQPCLHYQL